MGDNSARAAILARRARFLAAALASTGLVAGSANCGGDTTQDRGAATGGNGGTGAVPEPCLSAPVGGGGTPQPCLTGGTGGWGGTPEPCLSGAGPGGVGGYEPDAEPDATEDAAVEQEPH